MEVGQERLRMSNLHKIFKNDKNSKSMKVGPGAIQGYTLGIFTHLPHTRANFMSQKFILRSIAVRQST